MALKREQTEALLELYFEAEERIIQDMARRIATYDYFIPAAQHQMKSLEQMGKCRADIYRQLGELSGRREEELAQMLKQAVADNLAIDREIYKANNLDVDAALESANVVGELKAGFEQTNGTLKNITGTTARLGAVQFQTELDNAWLMVSSGAFSPDEAVRQTVNRLADSGVKAVQYESGRTLGLEAAVRMCVATGAAQTAAKSRIVLAGEVGCDLVEVTAHAGARPEHAEWQGSICSLSGKSRKYPSLREHTGYGTVTGLCGVNCSHSFFPWFEGSSRNWTEDELAKLSEPKYEYNGKKLTEYEATQVQRGTERNIRVHKRRMVGLEAAGQDSTAAAAKVREWQSRQREFLAATGLKRKSAREQVAGFGKTENAAVTKAAVFTNRIISIEKTSTGVNVTAVSSHLLERADERGVKADDIADALTMPLKLGKIRADNSQQFTGEFATVVVNVKTGKVVTVWKTSKKMAEKLKER